jgi:hypothetical protein
VPSTFFVLRRMEEREEEKKALASCADGKICVTGHTRRRKCSEDDDL